MQSIQCLAHFRCANGEKQAAAEFKSNGLKHYTGHVILANSNSSIVQRKQKMKEQKKIQIFI